MPVVLADLRDRRLRHQLRESPVGGVAGALYAQLTGLEPGHLTDAPMRLLVLLPIDADLTEDAESLALALLGVDPHPRTIVAALDGVADEEPERDADVRYRVLPNEFARSADVRFLDLRSPMLTVAHPRFGSERVGTGPRDPWVRSFVRDLVVQLRDRAVFDIVWSSIPRDQPATIGMRIASLGSGRDRAVADLALRLGESLRADHEPDMGQRLPERWQVDPGLLPTAPVPPRSGMVLSKSVTGLAKVAHEPATKVLSRSPSDYNKAVREQLQTLTERPEALAVLFERAAAPDADGPRIHPVGAVELDQALGGVIFGDPVAREWEAGEDAAERIGRLLADAATRQADGLSAAVLATWLRADAERVQPMGPAKVAESLRDADRPWAILDRHVIDAGDGVVPSTPRGWVTSALQGRLREPPRPAAPPKEVKPVTQEEETGADAAAATSPPQRRLRKPPASDARTKSVTDPWKVPAGLGAVLGSPVWRHRPLGFLYLLATTLVVVLAAAQLFADVTGVYLIRAADLGLDGTEFALVRILLFLVSVLLVGYGLISLAVASAVRRWADFHRFEEVPSVLETLENEAARLAVVEVARCAVRREYARVARAAADALERAADEAAAVAREFGTRTEAGARSGPDPEVDERSPHRRLLGGAASLTGTDAGGIYRIYPMYVQALRALFAEALVSAVREKWPRIRGVFWTETEELVSAAAAGSLRTRLDRVLEVGLQRGDLARDGIDPADELAARLWSDPVIRDAALEALQFEPDEPMPILATPADNRLLDASVMAPLILAIPPTLQPLLAPAAERTGASIIVTEALETAAAIRVFPFQPELYDFREVTITAAPTAS